MKISRNYLIFCILGVLWLATLGCKDGQLPDAQVTLGKDEALRQASLSEGDPAAAEKLDLFKQQPQTAHFHADHQMISIDVGSPDSERYLHLDVPLDDLYAKKAVLQKCCPTCLCAPMTAMDVHYTVPMKADLSASEGEVIFDKISIRPGEAITVQIQKAMIDGIELNGTITATMDESGTTEPVIVSFSPAEAKWDDTVTLKGFNFPTTIDPENPMTVSVGEASFNLEPLHKNEAQFHITSSLREDGVIQIKQNGEVLDQTLSPLVTQIQFVTHIPLEQPVAALAYDVAFDQLWVGLKETPEMRVVQPGGDYKKIALEDQAVAIDVSETGSRVVVCHALLSRVTLFNLVGAIDNAPQTSQIPLPETVRCVSTAFGHKDNLMILMETLEGERHLLFVDAKNGVPYPLGMTATPVPFEKLLRSPSYDRVVGISASLGVAGVYVETEAGFEPAASAEGLVLSSSAALDSTMGYFFSGDSLYSMSFKELGAVSAVGGMGAFSADGRTLFVLESAGVLHPVSTGMLKTGSPIHLFKKGEESLLTGVQAYSEKTRQWFVAGDKSIVVIDTQFVSNSMQK